MTQSNHGFALFPVLDGGSYLVQINVQYVQ